MSPIVLVHGGAGTMDPSLHEGALLGVQEAVRRGMGVLGEGGDALDAAVAATRVLEDNPAYNAGRGSCQTREGAYEMDAAVMLARPTGEVSVGAVASVSDCADAVLLAQAVLRESPHALLVGAGALAFAREHGLGTFGREHVHTDKAQARFDAARSGEMVKDGRADTVGCVVLDAAGALAAASSTGGVLLKAPGRVGDVPMVGGGIYARQDLGVCVATGMGEAILLEVAAHEVLCRVAAGRRVQEAAQEVCDRVARVHGATCGLLVIGPGGEVGIAHRSEHMSYAHGRGMGVDAHLVEFGLARP